MYPDDFTAEDRLILTYVADQVPGLQGLPTFRLILEEGRGLSWILSEPLAWLPEVTNIDLAGRILQGTDWRKYGASRNWAITPLLLKNSVGLFFGLERILIRDPRAYPVAFYWIMSRYQASTLLVPSLTALIRKLDAFKKGTTDGETQAALTNTEATPLAMALGLLDEEPSSLLYVRTNPFDEHQERVIGSDLRKLADTSLESFVIVGPESHLARYSRTPAEVKPDRTDQSRKGEKSKERSDGEASEENQKTLQSRMRSAISVVSRLVKLHE